MSTIFACLSPDSPVAESTITALLASSDYWQPDAISIAANSDNHCRMARAALFNTAASKLEAVHRDIAGNLISANARLDNRTELATQLGIASNELARMADGELILAAYRQWGEASPEQLLGDFAFAIFDAERHTLFCARDHFGVKVLSYGKTRHGIMVSNEHNAFFTSGAVEKQIREAWLVNQLWGLGGGDYESPCHGIDVLPPAHSMRIAQNGNIAIQRYWSLEDKNDWADMDDEVLLEELKQRFEQAVVSRLDSEYPLSAQLSEGIDSNGIAGYAARALGEKPLYTLSYGCIEMNDDNRHVWEATCRDIFEMHAMHANIRPIWRKQAENNRQAQQDQNTFNRHIGATIPVRDGAHLSYSRLAGELGIRTMLSGWGGDHCVSTYGDCYESELLNRGHLLATHRLLRAKRQRGRAAPPAKSWAKLLFKHLLPPLYRSTMRKREGVVKGQLESARSHPLKAIYIKRYQLLQKLRRFHNSYERYSVKAHHRRELFDIGVEKRLVESELCARMYRIEFRYPLLDVRLVELAYNMPSHLKLYRGIERYMFRKILDGVTTGRIQWRIKSDVQHPGGDRQASAAKREPELNIDDVMSSELVRSYFDEERLRQLAGSHPTRRMLKGIDLLLEIERQIRDNETRIVADP